MAWTKTSELRQVVQETIDQGRLGTPQFLRCIVRAGGPGELDASLDELVSLGVAWFGSSPVQRYRLGEGSGVYVTEMLKWPGGQGAVVTVSSASTEGAPHLDLMLMGSRGTLYHDEPLPTGPEQGASST